MSQGYSPYQNLPLWYLHLVAATAPTSAHDGLDPLQLALSGVFSHHQLVQTLHLYLSQKHMGGHCNLHCVVVVVCCIKYTDTYVPSLHWKCCYNIALNHLQRHAALTSAASRYPSVSAPCLLQSCIQSMWIAQHAALSMHGPSTSYTRTVLTWPIEVQVTGLHYTCITCKAVVETVMGWLEVEELQLDKLLAGWRDCLCQCCGLQVPITDHHPILVEEHSEVTTCVSGATADVEGSSSVEVVAELWVSKCIVAWPHSRRWYQTRYQREACNWQGKFACI